MKASTAAPFILIFLAGLMDYLTTESMLKDPRFYETRPYYVPFLAAIILSLAVAAIMQLKNAPSTLRWAIIAFLIALYWTAPINNLAVYVQYT
jgi:hypothetical protein